MVFRVEDSVAFDPKRVLLLHLDITNPISIEG
jgi:hypothetical protein